jgi:hypothetical protein
MNVALLGKTAYNNTLARINRQRGQSLQQYGYQGDVDPVTGVLKNVHVDPNSQYGDFQSMLRNQATIAQQAEYANQDRGLRGGMANKALSDARYGFGQQSAQLGTNFANTFTDFQDQQAQAKYEYDRALYEQQLLDAQNAIANGGFNPAGDGGGDGSGGDYGYDSSDGGTVYGDPYAAGAAAAVAGGYGGYVHPSGGGSVPKVGGGKAKPSAARVAKTTAKVTSKPKTVAGWKQVK